VRHDVFAGTRSGRSRRAGVGQNDLNSFDPSEAASSKTRGRS